MRESSSRIWVDGLTPPALGIAAVVWLFCSADRDLSRQRREVGTCFVGPNSVRPQSAERKFSATTDHPNPYALFRHASVMLS